jgi:hypothetical protein
MDFIVDDENWHIRYMVLDASNLDADKQALVALEWIEDIDVAMKEVLINLKKDAIRFSPPFDPSLPVNHQYEEVLYDYYGQPKHWDVVDE